MSKIPGTVDGSAPLLSCDCFALSNDYGMNLAYLIVKKKGRDEMKELARHHFFDTALVYICQEDNKNVEWVIIPKEKEEKLMLPKRQKFDSFIQLKLTADDYPKGFVTGHSMRNSETVKKFSFSRQEADETTAHLRIDTFLTDDEGNEVKHTAICDQRTGVIETFCTFTNHSGKPRTLEMFASFSLSGLSPFGAENGIGNLILNRFRSKWSMEGRLERQPIEYYQLEPSWKPSGAGLEKFGQVGSMPVRGFFPYLCVEDEKEKVAWSIQLANPGSWQIEAYRLDEDLCISGGLVDADYGQWKKTVESGESFQTPSAFLTVCIGSQQVASQRLTDFHGAIRKERRNELEDSLPVQFNEFCTTWGHPNEEQIRRDIEVLKGHGISYYVIDAGWYADEKAGWENNMGDWNVNKSQFPSGLETVVKMIREAGLVPGIWFEFETVGRTASVFHQTDLLLKKDGVPITAGHRRFWDMRRPEVQDFLKVHVIDFLKKYNFGYLKIDYNENFGAGTDHKDSLGEGNREQLTAVQHFFKEIHQEMPWLVMENCSSGGHRLEPSMMKLTDLSSFSDAHEMTAIPIIAANLHQLIHPAQSLIWAVLRQRDDAKKLFYSMTSTFLGRVCLSGDIHELTSEQWQIADQGLVFYSRIRNLIKVGHSCRFGDEVLSYRYPEGCQAVFRCTKEEAVVIAHHFKGKAVIEIPLKQGGWQLSAQYGVSEQQIDIQLQENKIRISFNEDFQACALFLKRQASTNQGDV